MHKIYLSIVPINDGSLNKYLKKRRKDNEQLRKVDAGSIPRKQESF